MKGQASSELLIVLGAVLLIGLVVIGMLMFYPGTSEGTGRTQNDIYWRNANPIAVLETRGFAGSHILRVKNLGSEKIYIENVRVGDNNVTWISSYGNEYDETSLFVKVGPSLCSELNCHIELSPGAETFIQYTAFDEGGGGNSWSGEPKEACGLKENGGETAGTSFNSLRKYAKAPLSIYYSVNGITKIQMGSVDLFVDCIDYEFRCSADQDCTDKYCSRSPCIQGMCGAAC